MINCFQFCFNFTFKFNLRRYNLVVMMTTSRKDTGRGLHSSTFQINLSRFGHTSPCPPV